jgi:hypothetical protein
VSALTVIDPVLCPNAVTVVGNMYRVEVGLDDCGTTVEYGYGEDGEYSYIVFKNSLKTAEITSVINYESRVTNTFECQFDAITTVDDINGGEAACLLDPDCQGGGGFNVTLVKETLDKEELGTFSFELVTFSNGARGFVQFTKQIQNFNLKKFI